jgi:hypothetical protein
MWQNDSHVKPCQKHFEVRGSFIGNEISVSLFLSGFVWCVYYLL